MTSLIIFYIRIFIYISVLIFYQFLSTCIFIGDKIKTLFKASFFELGGRGGRKLDDVREKYQRACRRLHLVHNEYVLLIAEAQESKKDFQTVMMPAFMQHHQQELENIIVDWLV